MSKPNVRAAGPAAGLDVGKLDRGGALAKGGDGLDDVAAGAVLS